MGDVTVGDGTGGKMAPLFNLSSASFLLECNSDQDKYSLC